MCINFTCYYYTDAHIKIEIKYGFGVQGHLAGQIDGNSLFVLITEEL